MKREEKITEETKRLRDSISNETEKIISYYSVPNISLHFFHPSFPCKQAVAEWAKLVKCHAELVSASNKINGL